MRSIVNYILLLTGITVFLAACTKVDELPRYEKGNAVELKASATSIAPAPADSAKSVVDFNWSNPNYATDTANYKFIVEIDSAGRGFSAPFKKEVKGTRSFSLTGRELNTILVNYGFALGRPHSLDVRVTSSYANNNEQYLSNVVKLNVTPYSDPSKLETTATSVSGTLSTASQKALTFNWSPSFPGYAGEVTYTLQYDSSGKNFASPWQILVGKDVFTKDMTKGQMNEAAINSGIAGGAAGKVDFRIKATTAQGAVAYSNAVSVTVQTYVPLIPYDYPQALNVAGNFQGWSPSSAPQIVSMANDSNYIGFIYFDNPTPEFKLVKGDDWGDGDFGDAGNNTLGNGGANLTLPSAGHYRLTANTKNMTWNATKIDSWGVIGSATTPGGWNTDTDMTYNPATGAWTVTLNLIAGEIKFRANDGWDINLGDKGNDKTLEPGGDNIPISAAGNYTITLNLTYGGNWSYTIKMN